MRGNGLSAEAYVAVADLDPGTADALLAALRDRGVAAYAAASPDPADRSPTVTSTGSTSTSLRWSRPVRSSQPGRWRRR